MFSTYESTRTQKSGRTSTSLYLQHKWDIENYENHKYNIRTAKHHIDNEPPKTYTHMYCRPKRFQMEMERFCSIQRDNKLLMDRLATINKKGAWIDNKNCYEIKSLNTWKRQQEMFELIYRNQAIYKRLLDAHSAYNINKMEDHYMLQRKYEASMAKFSTDWRSTVEYLKRVKKDIRKEVINKRTGKSNVERGKKRRAREKKAREAEEQKRNEEEEGRVQEEQSKDQEEKTQKAQKSKEEKEKWKLESKRWREAREERIRLAKQRQEEELELEKKARLEEEEKQKKWHQKKKKEVEEWKRKMQEEEEEEKRKRKELEEEKQRRENEKSENGSDSSGKELSRKNSKKGFSFKKKGVQKMNPSDEVVKESEDTVQEYVSDVKSGTDVESRESEGNEERPSAPDDEIELKNKEKSKSKKGNLENLN